MKNGKRFGFTKALTILLAVLLVSVNSFVCVSAETKTVREGGKPLSDANATPLKLDTSKVPADGGTNIPYYDGEYSDVTVPPVANMVLSTQDDPHVYYVIYDSALDYFGKMLTVRVDVEFTNAGSMPASTGFTKIYRDKNNLVKVQWRNSFNVKVQWKITILDPDTNTEYPINVYIGFEDPDESNYLFTTTNLTIFYNEAAEKGDSRGAVVDSYLIEDTGLYRAYKDGDTYKKYDIETQGAVPTYRDDGRFFVSMNDQWSSFTFESNTFENGSLIVPYFYSYTYNVAYDANRPTGTTGTGEMKTQTGLEFEKEYSLNKNQFTTDGYTWIGWNLKKDGTGKSFKDEEKFTDSTIKNGETVAHGETVTLYGQWAPIYNVDFDANRPAGATGDGKMEAQTGILFGSDETLNKNTFTTTGYKWIGWNTAKDGTGTSFKDEADFNDKTIKGGATVAPGETVILYGQWEPYYHVAYDGNIPSNTTGSGSVDPQNNVPFGKDETLNENKFSAVGYEFIGWNTAKDGTGTSFADKDPYNDKTIKGGATVVPDETVTLYAQWKPLEYKINYDPNGGEGKMDSHTYEYFDPEMKSHRNLFERWGYNFIGFLYTNPEGTSTLYKDIYDFKQILLAHPDREITLVAQWERIPNPARPHTTPKTGIE